MNRQRRGRRALVARKTLRRSARAGLALTVAMVLGVGLTPAFADGTTPTADATATSTPTADAATPAADPTSTDTASSDPSPAADPTSTDTASSDPSPAADPAPADTASSDPSPAAPVTSSTTSTGGTKTTKSTAPAKSTTTTRSFSSTLAALAVGSCLPGTTPTVGGFQIDGDPCAEGGIDWENTGTSVVDGFGPATWFKTGASSENQDPSKWVLGGNTQKKTDVDTAYGWTQVVSGTVYSYFGFLRHTKTDAPGDVIYDIEYNQKPDVVNAGGVLVPDRIPGDILVVLHQGGGTQLDLDSAWRYALGQPDPSCEPVVGSAPAASWCPMTPGPSLVSSVNPDGSFAEGALNINNLISGDLTCSGSFGVINMRSRTSHTWNTIMGDYISPLAVQTPSTCGKIVINKQDLNGNPLAGATFTVSPNPDPNQANGTPYSITDNDAKDQNPADGVIEISPVDPNESYTVTETGAPTGYLLASPAAQGPTLVGPSQTATFTFKDPKKWDALTASKTATPTYTASYAWSITKQIGTSSSGPWSDTTTAGSPLVSTVPATTDPVTGSLWYRVKVLEGARTTSDYKVSGTIKVTNPNTDPVTATVSDSLSGATCTVEGQASLTQAMAPGVNEFAYVCSFAGVPALGELQGDNTASVTWSKADYPQAQGDVGAPGSYQLSPTAGYAFGAETTSVNKSVTLGDTTSNALDAITYVWSANGTVNTTAAYENQIQVAAGTCSAVIENIATLYGDNKAVLGSDSAYGQICAAADLQLTRVDAETLVRTYPWSVEKSTTTPRVDVSGGSATADYQVTVTAGDGVDSDWSITGTITAKNPNDFESVDITAVPVSYTGGGTCSVTGTSFPYTLAAGTSHDFAYSCTFGGVQPNYSGTINASIEWSAVAAGTPSGSASDGLAITEADWDLTKVNETVTLHDDYAVVGADNTVTTLTWADVYALPNHQKVIDYSIKLPDLPDAGACTTDTNTVWLTGDRGEHLDADQNSDNNSATVTVCDPVGLGVGTTAGGDYTRSYAWSIDKFINTDQKSQTVTQADAAYTFDYSVVATPGARTDSGWVISGTVTVTNQNTDPLIAPIELTTVDVTPDVGTTTSCSYGGTLPVTLASTESTEVSYTCTVDPTPTNDAAEPPVYGGTVTAEADWGLTGMADSGAQSIVWNDPTEVDKSMPVYDNQTSAVALPVLLGNAEWNAEGTPTVFGYSLPLSAPDLLQTPGCAPPFVNTAWLGGEGIVPTDLQSNAEAVICRNPPVLPPVIPPEQPPVLPPTGGPDLAILLGGLALTLGGGLLILVGRRRKLRS